MIERKKHKTPKSRQIIDEGSTRIPGTDKVSRGGTGALGVSQNGAPGASKCSPLSYMAIDVIHDLSRETGYSMDQCEKMLYALGRVGHNYMTSGRVLTIPHLGFIYVAAITRRNQTKAFAAKVRSNGRPRAADKIASKDCTIVRRNSIRFTTTPLMSRYYDDYGYPSGSWRHHAADNKKRLLALRYDTDPKYAIHVNRAERAAERAAEQLTQNPAGEPDVQSHSQP